MLRHTEDKN